MQLLEQYRYSCLTTQATREVMCGWLLWMWFKGCHGVLIYFTYLGIIDQHCISLLYGLQVWPLTIGSFGAFHNQGTLKKYLILVFALAFHYGLHVLVKLQIRIKSDLLQAKHWQAKTGRMGRKWGVCFSAEKGPRPRQRRG